MKQRKVKCKTFLECLRILKEMFLFFLLQIGNIFDVSPVDDLFQRRDCIHLVVSLITIQVSFFW